MAQLYQESPPHWSQKKRQKEYKRQGMDAEECCEMLSSGHGMAIARVKLQQLRLAAKSCTRSSQSKLQQGGGNSQGPCSSLSSYLQLTTPGGKESLYFGKDGCPLVGYSCSSGQPESHEHMSNTNQNQQIMKERGRRRTTDLPMGSICSTSKTILVVSS